MPSEADLYTRNGFRDGYASYVNDIDQDQEQPPILIQDWFTSINFPQDNHRRGGREQEQAVHVTYT